MTHYGYQLTLIISSEKPQPFQMVNFTGKSSFPVDTKGGFKTHIKTLQHVNTN